MGNLVVFEDGHTIVDVSQAFEDFRVDTELQGLNGTVRVSNLKYAGVGRTKTIVTITEAIEIGKWLFFGATHRVAIPTRCVTFVVVILSRSQGSQVQSFLTEQDRIAGAIDEFVECTR